MESVKCNVINLGQVFGNDTPDVARRQALVVPTDRMGERYYRSIRNRDPGRSLRSTPYLPPPTEDSSKNQHGGEDSK